MTTFFDKNTKSNIIILPVLLALFGIYKFPLLLRLYQDVFQPQMKADEHG
jgi:hypothetical protein